MWRSRSERRRSWKKSQRSLKARWRSRREGSMSRIKRSESRDGSHRHNFGKNL